MQDFVAFEEYSIKLNNPFPWLKEIHFFEFRNFFFSLYQNNLSRKKFLNIIHSADEEFFWNQRARNFKLEEKMQVAIFRFFVVHLNFLYCIIIVKKRTIENCFLCSIFATAKSLLIAGNFANCLL